MANNKIKFLVADTTAFINSVQLNEYAETVLTVPDVVNEVKNKRQIRRLVVLPFDLQIREPSEECLAHVTKFAKKTGDYYSLSAIDMKIIALTFELEKENEGVEHLRTEPILSKVIVSKDKPEEFFDNSKLAGFFSPKERSDEIKVNDPEMFSEENVLQNDENQCTESEFNSKLIENEDVSTCFEKINIIEDELVNSLLVSVNQNVSNSSGESEEESYSSDSDDESDWITPSNIGKVKSKFEGNVDNTIPTVACMTTDYAIQNVLKQFNLNVSALNGRIIKHLRTYILRCYACFKTTSITSKVFCPNCGNKTLKRVAVSLDENGREVIHVNTKRPLTSKFKNQSLPRPKGGKHSRNPIIVEDQPIPKQMPSRVAKTKTNALDEDYIAGFSPFVARDINSKSSLLRSKGGIKQWARNNTFEEQRRKKHFNRLVK